MRTADGGKTWQRVHLAGIRGIVTVACPTSTVCYTGGYGKAEVTRGGVSTEELSSKTLEARNVPGLFFIGEVVDVTGWVQDRANALLQAGNREVKRLAYALALRADTTHEEDLILPYVQDLARVAPVLVSAHPNAGPERILCFSIHPHNALQRQSKIRRENRQSIRLLHHHPPARQDLAAVGTRSQNAPASRRACWLALPTACGFMVVWASDMTH